jgi:thymidylate kinase
MFGEKRRIVSGKWLWEASGLVDTKLVLIEGLPGAGKSTTTSYLCDVLQRNGYDCRRYLEEDKPHPIDCLDFELAGLQGKLLPLWERFVRQAVEEPVITIMESRLWQNTAMYQTMGGHPLDEIIQLNQTVAYALTPLSPYLFYLDQDDTEGALRRLYDLRGTEWMDWAFEETMPYQWFQSRGLKGFSGWVEFFKEWRDLTGRLFNDWPHRKARIMNPHGDWARSYAEMREALGIDEIEGGK